MSEQCSLPEVRRSRASERASATNPEVRERTLIFMICCALLATGLLFLFARWYERTAVPHIVTHASDLSLWDDPTAEGP